MKTNKFEEISKPKRLTNYTIAISKVRAAVIELYLLNELSKLA